MLGSIWESLVRYHCALTEQVDFYDNHRFPKLPLLIQYKIMGSKPAFVKAFLNEFLGQFLNITYEKV